MKLKIGQGLSLPLDAATETFAILGRRGSGKTHTAVVMAEEMLAADVPVVVLDPLDVWWGLRVSKDGKAAGFPIYVAGGSHPDIPLPADAGKVLADAIVDRGLSMVLSVRHLSKSDQRRFVGDFCERLYDRKADPKHRTALHVFIDEADAFVPQRLVPGAERCYGAVDTMVRRGRSSGLAVTLISQRPQVIAKDVLSQTEVLVSHQLTGPQDRKALEAWIEANDTENQRDAFMGSLASLPKGTAWFWSPGLLDVFKRVEVRDRQTFDSSATPKAGVRAVASPKAFAAVDLAKLTAEIAATIEKAKAEDPRELRKLNADLRAQIAAKDKVLAQVDVQAKRIEERLEKVAAAQPGGKVTEIRQELARHRRALGEAMKILAKVKVLGFPVETDEDRKALEQAVAAAVRQITGPIEKRVTALAERVEGIRTAAGAAEKAIAALLDEKIELTVQVSHQAPYQVSAPARPVKPAQHKPLNGDGEISPVMGKIISALAELRTLGAAEPARELVALLSDYTNLTSKGFVNAMSALSTAGWVYYPNPGAVALTEEGWVRAEKPDAPRTPTEVQRRICDLLGGKSAEILQPLIAAYPNAMPRADVAAAAGYTNLTSKGFVNAMSRLRTLGFVDYPDTGSAVAMPVLFLEGR